jgi:hypothetical protein
MWRKAATGGAGRDALGATTRWAGRLACVAGVAAWSCWFVWRFTSAPIGAVSLLVLVVEVFAFSTSIVLGAALWSLPRRTHPVPRSVMLPDVVADLVGLDELRSVEVSGADDSGEVARARLGLRLLDPRAQRRDTLSRDPRRQLATAAWSLTAVEGIRRLVFVVLLVAVLLTGQSPFAMPPWWILAMLIAAQVLFAVGHWALSGGALWPGVRLRWSMASLGAGLGDGASRSGLPIRWAATMATMIALNLAVALRGLSDRWTHGLGPMPHDERVVTMIVAWWLVIVGFAALRVLVQPSLGFYGATHRLEENSTRRLALGTTLAVAAVGFVAGVLPGGLPA